MPLVAGLKTVIAGLTDEDTFSLVKFSTRAEVVMPPTVLDAAGRAAAIEVRCLQNAELAPRHPAHT